jgi:NAD(P)-dependent dehydrogenase (short-subunit alcohol dehydrogenase family)
MGKLDGKVAVITGGTEGIGFATAQIFVKEGAYVFITGRRKKELDEAVTAIGSNVSGIQGDVARLADLDRLYETVGRAKGQPKFRSSIAPRFGGINEQDGIPHHHSRIWIGMPRSVLRPHRVC